jgi:hypothetical protein
MPWLQPRLFNHSGEPIGIGLMLREIRARPIRCSGSQMRFNWP